MLAISVRVENMLPFHLLMIAFYALLALTPTTSLVQYRALLVLQENIL
jgi:hypothetical protein